MKDPATIVRECYEAYVSKDRSAIEELIGDLFHFTSPLDNRIDRKTYFERCWPNSEHSAQFDFIHLIPHGNKVIVTYEATNINGERFQNTEILTVQQEKIVEVEVYFGWSNPHKAPVGSFTTDE